MTEHWRDRIQNPELGHTANDLTPTVESLFEDMMRGAKIDFRDLGVVNAVQLCVALRATYDRRDSIPGWGDARSLAILACINEGIDVEDAMLGLLDDPVL